MTGRTHTRAATGAKRSRHYARPRPTGWVGWVFFAGMMMVLLGSFQAFQGFVALFQDDYYQVSRNGLVVSVDYTTWGLVHLLLGAVAFLAGIAVISGRTWGRVIGIIMAAVGAIVNMAFIAANPGWTVIIITVDIVIIYALAVHGREARAYAN